MGREFQHVKLIDQFVICDMKEKGKDVKRVGKLVAITQAGHRVLMTDTGKTQTVASWRISPDKKTQWLHDHPTDSEAAKQYHLELKRKAEAEEKLKLDYARQKLELAKERKKLAERKRLMQKLAADNAARKLAADEQAESENSQRANDRLASFLAAGPALMGR